MNHQKAAQKDLDGIVAQILDPEIGRDLMMGSKPVEATNKNGFKTDRVPCEQYGSWDNEWTTHNKASLLVGAYFSKYAFVKLVWLFLRERDALREELRQLKHAMAARPVVPPGDWTPARIDWSAFPPKIECWHCDAPNGWTISVMIPPGYGHGEVVAWPIGVKARGTYVDDYFVFEDGYSQARVYDQAEVAARVAEICRADPPPAKRSES